MGTRKKPPGRPTATYTTGVMYGAEETTATMVHYRDSQDIRFHELMLWVGARDFVLARAGRGLCLTVYEPTAGEYN